MALSIFLPIQKSLLGFNPFLYTIPVVRFLVNVVKPIKKISHPTRILFLVAIQ